MADPSPLHYHRDGAEWYCEFCDYHIQDQDYFIQHMLQRHSVTLALHDLTAPAAREVSQGEGESDARHEEGA
jgi:hypothetical protein